MEQMLREADPEVVLLGNSLVRAGVGPKPLGKALSPGKPVRVASGAEPGTRPANWYVILENRVYGQGLRPKLVVVGMIPSTLVQTEIRSEMARQSLAAHVGSYEPVVDRKVHGRETPAAWRYRMERNRGAFQEQWARVVRGLSVGPFHGQGEGSLLERGEAAAGPALEAVFTTDGALDLSLHQRVIPVALPDEEVEASRESSSIEQTFVPDMIDLAEEHGSRIVFVWFPLAASRNDVVSIPADQQADLVALLNERGAGWLDLHELGYPDSVYTDPVHLNMQGRKRLTADLAAALLEMDALGQGAFAPATLPITARLEATLEGTPPALGSLELTPMADGDPCLQVARRPEIYALSDAATNAAGMGAVSPLLVLENGQALERSRWRTKLKEAPCSGAYLPQTGQIFISPSEAVPEQPASYRLALVPDQPIDTGQEQGWWVYPGTTLRFAIEAQADASRALSLELGLEPILGQASELEVALDDTPIQLDPVGPAWVKGHAALARGGGTFTLTLQSPPDGPYALIRWLGLETDGEQAPLIGNSSRMHPPSVDLLPRSGRSTIEALTEPPAIDVEALSTPKPKVARFMIPDLADLDDQAISARLPCRACSPLVLMEDGNEAAIPAWACAAVQRGEPSQACQDGGRFLFTSSDGSEPATNGRSYGLVLKADRREKDRAWLYPGDRLRLRARIMERRRLRHGASTLLLQAVPISDDPQGALSIRLLGGEDSYLERLVPLSELVEGPLELALDRVLPVTGGEVTIELHTEPEASYLLLEQAVLRE